VTSTPGTDDHPEVSEISDFAEGILPPERSADLRSHLAGCALCTDVRSSLEEIRGLLATLPGPSRMPADVAGRIDAALAAEALISATAPTVEPSGEPRVSRETSTGDRRPSGHAAAPTGPGRPRTRRRGRIVLAAACAAAVLGLGGLLVQSLDSPDTPNSARVTASPNQVAAFSGTALPMRVHQLLAGTASPGTMQPGMRPDRDTPFTAQVPACVQRATGRSENPLAFSPGSYEGHPAYLLVLPHPGDSARVDAYVVDASCTSSGTTSGHLLTRQTYDRR
jgi:hypothetical protein